MCISFICMHVCVPCVCLLDPLEMGLQILVSHHMGTGTQTQYPVPLVLCKNNKYS